MVHNIPAQPTPQNQGPGVDRRRTTFCFVNRWWWQWCGSILLATTGRWTGSWYQISTARTTHCNLPQTIRRRTVLGLGWCPMQQRHTTVPPAMQCPRCTAPSFDILCTCLFYTAAPPTNTLPLFFSFWCDPSCECCGPPLV